MGAMQELGQVTHDIGFGLPEYNLVTLKSNPYAWTTQ